MKGQVIIKRNDNGDVEGLVFYVPISKKEQLSDGSWRVCGWGSVSDYVDSQEEIVDGESLEKAVEDWKEWRNIRLMHSATIAGTAPVVEIRIHPVTKTKAMWVETIIVEAESCKLLAIDAIKGFSIGGRANRVVVETVEVAA